MDNKIHKFDLYMNQQVFDGEYIDEDELHKACKLVHEFFTSHVIINLNNGYQLVFNPVNENHSKVVGNIISKDASNLQNYINVLKFANVSVKNNKMKKHYDKIALAITNYIRRTFYNNDIDGFSSYNPDFISNVIKSFNKQLYDCYETCDFSFLNLSKKYNTPEDKHTIYQTLREIVYILDLFYNHY